MGKRGDGNFGLFGNEYIPPPDPSSDATSGDLEYAVRLTRLEKATRLLGGGVIAVASIVGGGTYYLTRGEDSSSTGNAAASQPNDPVPEANNSNSALNPETSSILPDDVSVSTAIEMPAVDVSVDDATGEIVVEATGEVVGNAFSYLVQMETLSATASNGRKILLVPIEVDVADADGRPSVPWDSKRHECSPELIEDRDKGCGATDDECTNTDAGGTGHCFDDIGVFGATNIMGFYSSETALQSEMVQGWCAADRNALLAAVREYSGVVVRKNSMFTKEEIMSLSLDDIRFVARTVDIDDLREGRAFTCGG